MGKSILSGGRIQGKNKDVKRLDSLKKGSGLFFWRKCRNVRRLDFEMEVETLGFTKKCEYREGRDI